ncbi:hypothetical protein GOL32_20455 [Sinorhizobium medicae]|nr:hypothetical protein [Sinorhizobium medicae]
MPLKIEARRVRLAHQRRQPLPVLCSQDCGEILPAPSIQSICSPSHYEEGKMKRSRWYPIRVAPGYKRMESIIERNCRKDGFDIFMPSFYTELRHHRTKQISRSGSRSWLVMPS